MKEFHFTKKDFTIDTFRSGGPGGQNQNKRDTGVRITHDETGLVAESREHRTQFQNKKEAFQKLAKLIISHYSEDSKREINTETIRTYNEHHNYVKDHLSGEKFSFKDTVGNEDISELIKARMMAMIGQTNE